MWGLISVLLAVALHCLIFGIFTGAGKDARELLEDIQLKSDLALKIKAFRMQVFPPALYCIMLLVVSSVMGGAAHTPTMARVHMALMIFTVAYNLKTFWKEYRAVAENGRLLKQLNEIAAPVWPPCLKAPLKSSKFSKGLPKTLIGARTFSPRRFFCRYPAP